MLNGVAERCCGHAQASRHPTAVVGTGIVDGMAEPALRSRAPTFAARFTPSSPLERRLNGSLWSFRSRGWNGFLDFREPGIYFTHWGWGEWKTLETDRSIRLQNGYDPFFFDLDFDDDLTSFRCVRTNHSDPPVGDMLFDYTNQKMPAPGWR